MNSVGDVAFMADFSPAHDFSDDAALFYSHGRTTVIAEVGDRMPDGKTLAKVGTAGLDIAMNNANDVVFDATLTDGTEAIYLWRHGHLSLVVKTGTQTPGGVISDLDDFGLGWASTQLSINDWGQILFVAHFQDGGGAMLPRRTKSDWMRPPRCGSSAAVEPWTCIETNDQTRTGDGWSTTAWSSPDLHRSIRRKSASAT